MSGAMRRTLKPALTRPPDFGRFWRTTLDQLARIDPAVERQPLTAAGDERLLFEQLQFNSFAGARIGAYALSWQDAAPRPLVVHGHGYGSACQPQWDWARAGVNVVGVDVRGFGRSAAALPRRSKWGYVLTGCAAPETSVLRGAVCDYVRAADVARQLFAPARRCVLHGASFAGTLALMAEALRDVADLLVIAVPSLGWAEGRGFFVQSGSGAEISHYLDQRPEAAEDLMLVLRYFDAMNFAPLVTCPALVGIGLTDVVVPAKTVYAIANHLGGRREVMEFPESHSNTPEEQQHWRAFQDRWLTLAREGVPASFGRG